MHLMISSVTCQNTLKIGQIIMGKDHQMLKEMFGDTFTVKKEIPLDFITDISGNVMLEDRTFSCITFNNETLINIMMLGFNGTPSELLRKHGLIYYSRGVNVLRIEEVLTRKAKLRLGLGV